MSSAIPASTESPDASSLTSVSHPVVPNTDIAVVLETVHTGDDEATTGSPNADTKPASDAAMEDIRSADPVPTRAASVEATQPNEPTSAVVRVPIHPKTHRR